MSRLKYLIRNYFGFSQIETNGFIILALLMMLFLFTPSLTGLFLQQSVKINSAEQKKLDSLLSMLLVSPNETLLLKSKEMSFASADPAEQVLFSFDPNTLSFEAAIQLGIPQKIARNVMKYRAKGGKFRVKKDLKKIYGFPEGLYAQLEPFIDLPDSQVKEQKKQDGYVKRSDANTKSLVFNLNTADTLTLQKVKGIGSVLSRRIVNYREKLGGFTDLKQLNEVFGLRPETVEAVSICHQGALEVYRKIKINEANEKELSKHPYIGYKLAKTIIKYKIEHGNYQSAKDLSKIKSIDQELIDKLAQYLMF